MLEVRGREVQIPELHSFELSEPDALELRPERRGVADEHDRQAIGLQIQPRHALDVVRRDGVHALAEVLQVRQRQVVEHDVEHLQRDVVRRFDREREAAGQYAFASSSSRSLTRSRCSRQNSSTMSRSTSPVASERVLVSASKSPLSFSVSMLACAP